MKAAISKLNQSGLSLDDEAVRTIQAASRPDWNPSEQLVLVTIPDLSSDFGSDRDSLASNPAIQVASPVARPHWNLPPLERTVPTERPQVSKETKFPVVAESLSQAATIGGAEPAGQTIAATNPPPGSQLPVIAADQSPLVKAEPKSPARTGGHPEIVESIVTRFGPSTSFLIHFCDIDRPRRSAEVCLAIGFELAERMQRRILLLDTSRTDRPLSAMLGVDLAAGFRETVRTDLNWRQLVRPTSHPLVDILPGGVIKTGSLPGSESEIIVRKLVGELWQRYEGICSCADSAYDWETELLGRCSSGAFLTMDFQSTSRGLAKATAHQLQRTGNRLLGCIAVGISD